MDPVDKQAFKCCKLLKKNIHDSWDDIEAILSLLDQEDKKAMAGIGEKLNSPRLAELRKKKNKSKKNRRSKARSLSEADVQARIERRDNETFLQFYTEIRSSVPNDVLENIFWTTTEQPLNSQVEVRDFPELAGETVATQERAIVDYMTTCEITCRGTNHLMLDNSIRLGQAWEKTYQWHQAAKEHSSAYHTTWIQLVAKIQIGSDRKSERQILRLRRLYRFALLFPRIRYVSASVSCVIRYLKRLHEHISKNAGEKAFWSTLPAGQIATQIGDGRPVNTSAMVATLAQLPALEQAYESIAKEDDANQQQEEQRLQEEQRNILAEEEDEDDDDDYDEDEDMDDDV